MSRPRITIERIASGLSAQQVWGGLSKKHGYSWAEHSVHVSKLVPEILALPALLWTATCYRGAPFAGGHRARRNMLQRFGARVTPQDVEIIAAATTLAYQIEARDLQLPLRVRELWGAPPTGMPKIREIVQEQACANFIARFSEAMVIWRKRKQTG